MSASRIKAYESIERVTLPAGELEASVLVRAAARLKECQDRWNEADHDTRLLGALEFSQRVWTFFQAELARPDHELPAQLRRDLLALSVFVDKRIFEVMVHPVPERLTAIININRDIAAGLRGTAVERA